MPPGGKGPGVSTPAHMGPLGCPRVAPSLQRCSSLSPQLCSHLSPQPSYVPLLPSFSAPISLLFWPRPPRPLPSLSPSPSSFVGVPHPTFWAPRVRPPSVPRLFRLRFSHLFGAFLSLHLASSQVTLRHFAPFPSKSPTLSISPHLFFLSSPLYPSLLASM